MEKNDHVERTRDIKDRRIVKIKSKVKGQLLINEVISRRCVYIDELIKDIKVIDKNKLIDYLEILNGEKK
jgi:MarR family transcriptional regulator, organic hydroperoxide resistance regulator